MCGKKTTRRATFSQTQNPYNISKQTGYPKTYSEIVDELNADIVEWRASLPKSAFVHQGCQ